MKLSFVKVCRGLFLTVMLAGLVGFHTTVMAQTEPESNHHTVSKVQSKIKIDGILNETAWQTALKFKLPYEWWPGDNTPAPVETECMITYSRTMLYIGFRCVDPEPGKIRSHLMDRDNMTAFVKDDCVLIMIDTFNDERRGFQFWVNPMGVQADANFSESAGFEDFSWDAIWDSAGKITQFGYTIEIALPFNQLRFPKTKDKQTWGFILERFYPRNVRHKLGPYPKDRNRNCLLCQEMKISGFEDMSAGNNLEFDPTLTLVRTDNRESFPDGKMESGKIKVEPGITARWGITPNAVLGATINPDFSQVEADAAQLEVNRRFALYYPEKRPFFLEGADFFKTPMEAVFTRTVFEPLWGLKLTGKAGKSAFGLFSTQDQSNNLIFPSNQGSWSTSIDEDVYGGVLRYRRDVGRGSTLGVLYTGRVGEDYYNHVGGVDGFLRLSRKKNLHVQFLHSRTDYADAVALDNWQETGAFNGNALFVSFQHAARSLYYSFGYTDISPGFRADYGFIPRVDYRQYQGIIQPSIWGKKGGWFDKISFTFRGMRVDDHDGKLTDQELQCYITYNGPMQSTISPSFSLIKEFYNGVTYDKTFFQSFIDFQPIGGMVLAVYTAMGDSIDYTNNRLGKAFVFRTGVDWAVGKHTNVYFNSVFERLSLEGERIYNANIYQGSLVYSFNVRTFVRAIVQYTDIDRNLDMYTIPINPETKMLFTQFLFSYKINPQTVLFIGYSDNHLGMYGIDLTQRDRTFFLKIGYALVL